MKELEEILSNIRKARDTYDSMTLQDTRMLSELLRIFNSNLFYLAEYRIKYHERWLDYYNNNDGSNASKERYADGEVRELYMIRHIHSNGIKLVDGIRSQIGIYKKEK